MEETLKNARLSDGQQISQDLLNKIAPSGMTPHKLTLKEGAPVMLLRNMHGARGQVNGTRMLIRKMWQGQRPRRSLCQERTGSCCCDDACEETVMHVKSHDQVLNALEPLPYSLFFSDELHLFFAMPV